MSTLFLQQSHKGGVHIALPIVIDVPLGCLALVQVVPGCAGGDVQRVPINRFNIQVADIAMYLAPGWGVAPIGELKIC